MSRLLISAIVLWVTSVDVVASEQIVNNAFTKWDEIQKLAERTDTVLRQDLDAAFMSSSATCSFYEQWFDVWNTIVNQEATIYKQSNKLKDDLLVARIGVRDPELREQVNLILITLYDHIEQTGTIASSIEGERESLQYRMNHHCGGPSQAEIEEERQQQFLLEQVRLFEERLLRKNQ